MGLSPMLGATFVKSRMSANQPMQLDTGNVTSPTVTTCHRVYSVHSTAGLREFATKDRAKATQRIKIITHAESDADKLMPKDASI